jgi:hypothetical protein
MELVSVTLKVLEEKGDILKIRIGNNYITLSKTTLRDMVDPTIVDPNDTIIRNMAVFLAGSNISFDEKESVTTILDNQTFKVVR